LCGKSLEKSEENVCRTCLEVLKHKYPNEKNFERRLKCYKKIIEKLRKK
jgi:hypothetical protein